MDVRGVRNVAHDEDGENKDEGPSYGRKFQVGWRGLLPWLVCVAVAGAGIEGGAAGAAAAAAAFPFREG